VSLPLIVMGDRTTHGGTVISADMTFDINGKCVARIGDMTVCPKCKGVFPIKSGAGDLVDGSGSGYARHMDSTACGAKLISSQITTLWSDKSSMGEAASVDASDVSPAAASAIAAVTESGVCLDCLVKAAQGGSPVVIRG
jgi:uncharacterized Zn-binding protein involved in type VI secretion